MKAPKCHSPSESLAECGGRSRVLIQERVKFVLGVLALIVISLWILSSRKLTDGKLSAKPHRGFDWFSLEPNKKFDWVSCYDDQKCARLILPLDYDIPDGPTVTIAVRMIPATDLENYRGTVFVNPGGPGTSGVDLIGRLGRNISTIVGASLNVLGFDPRGVGKTTPSATCFSTASQRDIWKTQDDLRLINESLPISRARAKLLVDRCEQRIGGEWGIGRFASSPYVARDMLEMTQLLGQEKLQYWGFSYGTLLGQYFATMYPNKIKRLVIDGVADAELYRASHIDADLEDTEAAIDSFFEYCFEAGPGHCILHDTTPDRIRKRYFRILHELEKTPLPVPFADPPTLITRKALLNQLFKAVFKPITLFPVVAETIFAIENGNQTAITGLIDQITDRAKCSCNSEPWTGSNEAFLAVQCADVDPVTYSKEAFIEHFTALQKHSSTLAPVWMSRWLDCADWKIRPKWNFTSRFESKTTSHPMLAISTRYDPVTPLTQARQVSRRFGGSVLLVQESYGHCSISSPSLCTAKHIREYFVNGSLPAPGSTCDVDELPFVGQTPTMHPLSAEEEVLLDALRGFATNMPTLDRW